MTTETDDDEVRLTTAQANKAIDDLLKKADITYSCVYVGETKRDGHLSDMYRVVFHTRDHSLETEFFQGIGLRKAFHYPNKHSADASIRLRRVEKKNPYAEKALRSRIDQRKAAEWDKENLKPIPPTAASVLYCLNMDRQACSQNFKDWCSELGFSDDSIKALNMYNACLTIGQDFMKVFTNGLPDKISEILKDY